MSALNKREPLVQKTCEINPGQDFSVQISHIFRSNPGSNICVTSTACHLLGGLQSGRLGALVIKDGSLLGFNRGKSGFSILRSTRARGENPVSSTLHESCVVSIRLKSLMETAKELQGQVPALMAAVLLRFARHDAFDGERIAILFVAEHELTFVVDTPELIGSLGI